MHNTQDNSTQAALTEQLKGFQTQAKESPLNGLIQGVAIPVKIKLPDGSSIRVYISVPSEVVGDFDTFCGALGWLESQGLEPDVWKPKNNYNNGGGFGGNNRGGYNKRGW